MRPLRLSSASKRSRNKRISESRIGVIDACKLVGSLPVRGYCILGPLSASWLRHPIDPLGMTITSLSATFMIRLSASECAWSATCCTYGATSTELTIPGRERDSPRHEQRQKVILAVLLRAIIRIVDALMPR